jgi:hypothetical protein
LHALANQKQATRVADHDIVYNIEKIPHKLVFSTHNEGINMHKSISPANNPPHRRVADPKSSESPGSSTNLPHRRSGGAKIGPNRWWADERWQTSSGVGGGERTGGEQRRCPATAEEQPWLARAEKQRRLSRGENCPISFEH